MATEQKERRKAWEFPWGYRESFMVVLELLLIGLILQVLTGKYQDFKLQWPINLGVALVLIALLFGAHRLFRHKPMVKWLSSVPAAVSSIVFFAFVVLLLGFIPQDRPDAPGFIRILGLNSIRHSWLLNLSGLYLLICLGMVILRRSLPVTRRNIGFVLNHGGLWIALFAGALGSGDIIKVSIPLTEGQLPFNIGQDQAGRNISLPFNLQLLDFKIDEYPLKVGIGNTETGEILDHTGMELFEIKPGEELNINEWNITIEKIIPDAVPSDGTYQPSDSSGSVSAAMVVVKNSFTSGETKGWIAHGSYAFHPEYLSLDDKLVLFMDQPEPEKYSSVVVIMQDGRADTVTIEVNKPSRAKGYSLYQMSYDDSYGKWSERSILEAVRDPWLPVVYAGVLMMLAGSVYLFWKGNEIRKE